MKEEAQHSHPLSAETLEKASRAVQRPVGLAPPTSAQGTSDCSAPPLHLGTGHAPGMQPIAWRNQSKPLGAEAELGG